jgi:mannose-1-phosphate guanylyltransferase
MDLTNTYLIIMAGGIGSRFWPMSRASYPKQFHDILNRGKTLIQETVERFESLVPVENIYIVTNERYLDLVQSQCPQLATDQILLEPVGRNTAPCIAYATYKILQTNPEATFVVAPADHLIAREAEFLDYIRLGVQAALDDGMIITLGITPTRPDTGYGYIQYIDDDRNRGFYKVKTFTEKPNQEVAESFIESGDFVWNAGLFIFAGKTIVKAFESYLPDMAELFMGLKDLYYQAGEGQGIKDAYAVCKSISIDYGIMEKADNVYVIPADFGWSDLGTWGSVHENSEKDFHQNAVHGDVIAYESFNNLVQTSEAGKLIVLKGLDGYIVVDTGDALLICKKEEEQFIKQIVSEIKADRKGKFT